MSGFKHTSSVFLRRLKTAAVLSVFSLLSFNLSASSEGGDFNAGEMIMHHISDAHEIHLIGDLAIYLPVIVQSEEGWDVFSSSHFYHNPKEMKTEEGKQVHYYEHGDYILFHEHIYYKEGGLQLNEEGDATNKAVALDMSITKNVAGMFLTIILMILIFTTVAKGYKKRGIGAPKGIQSFMEPLILFVRDEVARPSIGKHADRFVPFLLTIFFFIWISNLLGLIPFLGGLNITGTLSITMVLAAVVFVITSISGNKHYWGHILWPPNVPLPIKFILVPIEFAGIFIKPLVLMVRLTANITAGHIIILAFVCLIFIFGEQSAGAGYGVGIGSTLFMIFMNFIELLVAFLQAYVFTLLAALYFGAATEEAHH
ncbi:MAG: F0F1 ATP synthase subunit A [Vicingaceae bacterium]